MKINKKTFVLSLAVCLLPLVAGALLYAKLPERIPIHFNFAGEPDGYGGKAFALFAIPSLMTLLQAIFPFLLRADPKSANMSKALFLVAIWTVPTISVLCNAMSLGYALGYDMNVSVVISTFVGLIFVVIGNYLPKTKQSYTMGIKLPWTLNSEENWNRTHRLAGFLWVFCGAAFILFSLLRLLNLYLFLVLLFAMILIPTAYSYYLYRKGI